MFKNLFSKFGKKDKFFLELKEDAAKVVEQAEKAIEKTTDTIAQVVDKTEDKLEAAKTAVVSQGKNVVEPAQAALAVATQPKEKRSFLGRKKDPAKAKAKEVKAKTVEAAPKAEPKPAPASTASQNGKVEPQDVAFASKYPVMSTMSRRQPGPSLNMFKEMARQAKVPKRKG